jgi:hypothetical protein
VVVQSIHDPKFEVSNPATADTGRENKLDCQYTKLILIQKIIGEEQQCIF